jgi:hypothetical protein
MVLERLFNLTKNSNHDKPLIQLATEFFGNELLPCERESLPMKSIMDTKDKDIKHLVDLKRQLLTLFTEEKRESCRNPPSVRSIMNIKGIKHFVDHLNMKLSNLFTEKERERIGGWEVLPSATRLVEAGIKFKRRTSQSVLDIKFIDDCVLEIPPLVVIQKTIETVFQNLISFEQYYSYCKARITSYVIVLDNLINTAKDMDILCGNNIIEN